MGKFERFAEYMCIHCGKKERRLKIEGEPTPERCPKRAVNKAHSWLKTREY